MTFDRATSDCDDDDRNAMTVFHIHMIYSFYSNAMERNFILISYFYIIVFLFLLSPTSTLCNVASIEQSSSKSIDNKKKKK